MYFINLVILYKIINCMTRTNIFKVFRLRNYSILDEMVHPRFISYMIDFIMVVNYLQQSATTTTSTTPLRLGAMLMHSPTLLSGGARALP